MDMRRASFVEKRVFLNHLIGKRVQIYFTRTLAYSGRLMSIDDSLTYLKLSMVINLVTNGTAAIDTFCTKHIFYVCEDPLERDQFWIQKEHGQK
ncbi:hypothetical protein NPIL_41 [Nephila pilipes]|uniref:Uncharacterized protein n=1 Tax=Nephila pilipes TaxID=299642 RepID=A0A8X6TQC9_NEPPI|nr:hypothetical protein NPIL_41 [Nephila pilipes]